ncbi:MAG: FlgD immunoglobulin-like domain containing protein [candidate division WOR-3 bacterium]
MIEQFLPDPIEHDVGVTRLLAPSGPVDSGSVVVPACSVYNYRSYTETYPVRMRIGSEYDTTVVVTAHAPNTYRYIEFPDWTPRVRGQAVVRCSTELGGDDVASNNGQTGLVTVNVYDLAVTMILAPVDSVDSGSVVVPSAVVKNLGTVADMARVRFTIGDIYLDSANVPLQPGRCDTAFFDPWTPLELGTFPVRCTVRGRWEMVPENNLLTTMVRVVRPSGVVESQAGTCCPVLLRVMPNPGSGWTRIHYSLPSKSAIELRLYSAQGRLVRVLRSGIEPAGRHMVVWDGRDGQGEPAGCGVYYCQLVAGNEQRVEKLVRGE